MVDFEEAKRVRQALDKPLLDNILSGQSFEGRMTEDEFQYRFEKATEAYSQFLKYLGYDIDNDPNMKDTPKRVTKIWMKELGRGTYQAMPKITSFENRSEYDGMVFQGNITLRSSCSHHTLVILGRVSVAYIPEKDGTVIGLSKLNRIVDWVGRRPQLQEQMTQQIHDKLNELLKNNRGIAVMVEGYHSCVSARGIEDENSRMTTVKLSGDFLNNNDNARTEFYSLVARLPKFVM